MQNTSNENKGEHAIKYKHNINVCICIYVPV